MPHFWGCAPGGYDPQIRTRRRFLYNVPTPKFHHPTFTRPEVIVLTNKQTNTQTDKQTPLKTSNVLRYATTLSTQLTHPAYVMPWEPKCLCSGIFLLSLLSTFQTENSLSLMPTNTCPCDTLTTSVSADQHYNLHSLFCLAYYCYNVFHVFILDYYFE